MDADGIASFDIDENAEKEQILIFRVSGSIGRYSLIVDDDGISLWDSGNSRSAWTLKGEQ